MSIFSRLLCFLVCNLICLQLSAQTTSYSQQVDSAKKLYDLKFYRQAATVYSAANHSVTDPDPSAVYNNACAWALAGDPDAAFQCLKTIIGIDFFKYTQLTTDQDLISLHSDKRWLPLLDRIKKAKPNKISREKLCQDFDLLVSALKEAHTGLYWYNTKPQFDSICRAQRALIDRGMNALEFYQVVAPVVAFTKEGHTYVRLGGQAQAYLTFSGKFFPFYLKFLERQPYILNDIGNRKTRGQILTRINGVPMADIIAKFLSFEPSDGFNTTGKYRWIEENGKFSSYYAYSYPMTTEFSIEVLDPGTGQKNTFTHIPAVSYNDLYKGYRETLNQIPIAKTTLPATLQLDSLHQTAILTFNTFSSTRYEAAKMEFHQFVRNAFAQLRQQHIRHLILDIRNNGGGSEGYEDYLLSFLIRQDYIKYSYVQAPAFAFSFYPYSDYKYDWQKLERMLRREHNLATDGRILRKPGIEEHEKPQPEPFTGDLYVLTSGLTYSGGSEFASLCRLHTKATFIGEETGGGYYGNTSGNHIVLKLPNAKLEIGIPLLKFVIETPDQQQPFGRGVMPDYPVEPNITQFLQGYDPALEMARQLIGQKNSVLH